MSNTPAEPDVCAARAQHERPAAAAGDTSTRDPDAVARYAAVRERRATLTVVLREILAEQPTPRLVRTVAHRLANEIHLIADSIVRDMESTGERP